MTSASIPVAAPIEGGLSRWREVLTSHYLALGARSRRLRFLAPVADAALERLAGSARPDSVIGMDVDGKTRAVLEIFLTGQGHAEIGLSVEDAYQGRGYGRRLLLAGLERARSLGVTTADFYFDTANSGIRHLLLATGAEIRRLGGSEAYAAVDVSAALRDNA